MNRLLREETHVEMGKHETRLKVRSYELDFYGHVNNASYVQYLEFARVEMLYESALPFEDLAAMQAMPVVANLTINYRHSAKLNDDLLITTQVTRIGTSSVVMHHEAVNLTKESVRSFDADVVLVFIHPATGKSTPIPDAVRTKFALYAE